MRWVTFSQVPRGPGPGVSWNLLRPPVRMTKQGDPEPGPLSCLEAGSSVVPGQASEGHRPCGASFCSWCCVQGRSEQASPQSPSSEARTG